jgi:hypothetical protein
VLAEPGYHGTKRAPPTFYRPKKRERAMGAAMPFSKLKLLDPEQMEALHEAFRRVCDILQIDCGKEDKLTEFVVLKIVELAKAGERDPEILCIDVLAQLGTSSQDVTSREPPERACPMTSIAAE